MRFFKHGAGAFAVVIHSRTRGVGQFPSSYSSWGSLVGERPVGSCIEPSRVVLPSTLGRLRAFVLPKEEAIAATARGRGERDWAGKFCLLGPPGRWFVLLLLAGSLPSLLAMFRLVF